MSPLAHALVQAATYLLAILLGLTLILGMVSHGFIDPATAATLIKALYGQSLWRLWSHRFSG